MISLTFRWSATTGYYLAAFQAAKLRTAWQPGHTNARSPRGAASDRAVSWGDCQRTHPLTQVLLTRVTR